MFPLRLLKAVSLNILSPRLSFVDSDCWRLEQLNYRKTHFDLSEGYNSALTATRLFMFVLIIQICIKLDSNVKIIV
jgi:hypothetical protein